MYESPIMEFTKEISRTLVEAKDEMILKTVQNIGVTVDKDELIKALSYDRKQYAKGYRDAMAKAETALAAAKELLEKYAKERQKQIVAMRMAARSAAERQDIMQMKYRDEKEIREYEAIFNSLE